MRETQKTSKLTNQKVAIVELEFLGLEMKVIWEFLMCCRLHVFQIMLYDVNEVREWSRRCKERSELFVDEQDGVEILLM